MTSAPKLTPLGRSILEATYRGRVVYRTREQAVWWRQEKGQVLEVSEQIFELMRLGWALIEVYDPDQPPVPVEVLCWCTAAGEDALMEAAAAARKRKAKR